MIKKVKINKNLEKKIIECLNALDPKPIYLNETILSLLREKGFARIYEDYSSYVQGKSCDGGGYGFWTNAHLVKKGRHFYLELEERTTCDAFDFCSSCGTFNSHGDECKPVYLTI